MVFHYFNTVFNFVSVLYKRFRAVFQLKCWKIPKVNQPFNRFNHPFNSFHRWKCGKLLSDLHKKTAAFSAAADMRICWRKNNNMLTNTRPGIDLRKISSNDTISIVPSPRKPDCAFRSCFLSGKTGERSKRQCYPDSSHRYSNGI